MLSYPNLEVKEAFLVYLLGDYSPKFDSDQRNLGEYKVETLSS